MSLEVENPEPLPATMPIGSLQNVLAALADPVRLEMVRRLAAAHNSVVCSRLYDEVGKSTASHHFKILREAGITERLNVVGQTHQRLREAELEVSFPGLLASVVSAIASDPR